MKTSEEINKEFISKFTVWSSEYKYATLKGTEEYPTPQDIADWWQQVRRDDLQSVLEMTREIYKSVGYNVMSGKIRDEDAVGYTQGVIEVSIKIQEEIEKI